MVVGIWHYNLNASKYLSIVVDVMHERVNKKTQTIVSNGN